MSASKPKQIDRIGLSKRPELRSEIIDTLKGTRYFSQVPNETIEEVLKESFLVYLSPGDEVIEEGSEDIDSFYFLLRGSVGVHVEDKYLHSINDVGDAVGEMSVITKSPRSAGVIAEMNTQLVEIPWQVILDLQDTDPRHTNAFLSMMTVFLAEKLTTTTQRVYLYENFVVEVMEREQEKDEQTAELTMKFDQLEKSNEILKNLATRDQMTNLYNHAEFKDHLKRQIILFRRNAEPFSLVMGDLDDFKQINDTHGHLVGDEVIRNTANILVDSLREEVDTIYRYGGEEFAAILRSTPEAIAAIVLERVRVKLEATPVHMDGLELITTMSIGVGGFNPEWQMDEFIAKVDQAMYAAKRSGKNKVVSLVDPTTPRKSRRNSRGRAGKKAQARN